MAMVTMFGAALVGSLAYTFSDSFWFSAVEAEVYSTSSLFTAVVFWAILKWENVADEPGANRWLILIAYLMGLSIGDTLLFTVLCASASYIAVPAAVRVALPGANASLYLPMSLALTFPFNILFGIPLYHELAQRLAGADDRAGRRREPVQGCRAAADRRATSRRNKRARRARADQRGGGADQGVLHRGRQRPRASATRASPAPLRPRPGGSELSAPSPWEPGP